MSIETLTKRPMAAARQKLLDTALLVIRTKGYAATTIDELCRKAGVAKGSFFHHFKDKEALAIAAAEYWSEMTATFFEPHPIINMRTRSIGSLATLISGKRS